MNCPKCGGKMRVAGTHPWKGTVLRRRVCTLCDHCLYTEEIAIDTAKERYNLWFKNYNIQQRGRHAPDAFK